MNCKNKILIGKLSRDKTESISIITRSFIKDLKHKYHFIPFISSRHSTNKKGAQLTLSNFIYFLKDFYLWFYLIIKHRPQLAHYPITSYWNLEKSLCFLMVAKLFGIKTVGHLHGGAFPIFWNELSFLRKKIAFFCFNKLDALIVLSPGWKSKVSKIIPLEKKKIHVVLNPINSKFEKYALTHQYDDIINNKKVILGLGIIGKEKGIYDILKAAKILKDLGKEDALTFLLCGPEREPGIYNIIDSFISQNKLKNVILIKDGIWGDEKIKIFKKVFALILPSYIENFPAILIEGAAFGLPLISTKVGGVPEFFEDKKSILFIRPHDPEHIVENLLLLIYDEKLAKKLGENARKVYLNALSRKVSISQLDFIYTKLLNN